MTSDNEVRPLVAGPDDLHDGGPVCRVDLLPGRLTGLVLTVLHGPLLDVSARQCVLDLVNSFQILCIKYF